MSPNQILEKFNRGRRSVRLRRGSAEEESRGVSVVPMNCAPTATKAAALDLAMQEQIASVTISSPRMHRP
jgi:hypothetical protein